MYKIKDTSGEPYEVKEDVKITNKQNQSIFDINSFLIDNNFQLYNDGSLKLYHGSGNIVSKPSYTYKQREDLNCEVAQLLNKMDLGNGFYLDNCYNTTRDWGLLYSLKPDRTFGECYINVYSMNLTGLKVKVLDINNYRDILTYLACLCYYHGNVKYDKDNTALVGFIEKYYDEDIEDYDVIIAPRLDSKYKTVVRDFIEEGVGLDFFINILMTSNIGYQVYLQSKDSYNGIQFIHSYKVIDPDRTIELSVINRENAIRYYQTRDESEEQFKFSQLISDLAL